MAGVVEAPSTTELGEARRELGATLGELRAMGLDLAQFSQQTASSLDDKRRQLSLRDRQLPELPQPPTGRGRAVAGPVPARTVGLVGGGLSTPARGRQMDQFGAGHGVRFVIGVSLARPKPRDAAPER